MKETELRSESVPKLVKMPTKKRIWVGARCFMSTPHGHEKREEVAWNASAATWMSVTVAN